MKKQEIPIKEGAILRRWLKANDYKPEDTAALLGFETKQGLYYQLSKDQLSLDFISRIQSKLGIDVKEILHTEGSVHQPYIKNKLKSIEGNNTPVKNGKEYIYSRLQVIENEYYTPLLYLLPDLETANGWVKHVEIGEKLDTQPINISLMLQNSINNGQLMKIDPSKIYRIPDLEADRIVLVATDNMEGEINKGSEISLKWLEIDDVDYGYAYYIVHANGKETINYIRKSKMPGYWLLCNKNTEMYDDRDVPITKIKAVYDIDICLSRKRQRKISA